MNPMERREMGEHEHSFVLAKFTDNLDERPLTPYQMATSGFEWQGTALFICECGIHKAVDYSPELTAQREKK